MNRGGRYDLCLCGSGRQHKCCCGSSQAVSPSSGTRVLVERALAKCWPVVSRESERKHLEAFQRVLDRGDWSQAKNDAERVRQLIDADDVLVRESVTNRSRSRQLWFQLSRWAAPWLLERFAWGTRDAWPGRLGVRAIRLASNYSLRFLPSAEVPEWVDDGDSRGVGYALEPDDLLCLTQMVGAAARQAVLEDVFRFACKGARIFSGREANAEALSIVTHRTTSIELYEKRRDRFDTVAGRAGIWHQPDLEPRNPESSHVWTAALVAHLDLRIESMRPRGIIKPLFLPVPLYEIVARGANEAMDEGRPAHARLVPLDTLLHRFTQSVRAAYGVDCATLCHFLYALDRLIQDQTPVNQLRPPGPESSLMSTSWPDDADSSRRVRAWQRLGDICDLALIRASPEAWRHSLLHYADAITNGNPGIPSIEAGQVQSLIGLFSVDACDAFNADRPSLFVVLSPKTTALDLLAAHDFAHNLLGGIVRVEQDAACSGLPIRISEWHEEQTADYFRQSLNLEPQRMLVRRRITDVSSKKKMEVDLAFVWQRTLFVIDCKAMLKDMAFFRGEHRRLRNRRETVLKELTEKCPERARMIADGCVNDIIPRDSFSRVRSLVCTTAVEYLDLDETAMWSESCPLVGTPEELLASIKRLSEAP